MLRPATPLAGIFFVATLLLLLSSLTTPVISRLSLATFDGSRFGVWGYCSGPQTGSRCSPIEVGYKIYELRPTRDQFSVSEDTRHNVSYILIIHPVAALFSFVCFCMATATHWHAPGHSARFLMALFLLTLPTFLIALLAFLVDILLFIPHLSVGGWFVLAAVVLLLLANIVTCAMRRTLISRKARRKRIAANPEMNGDDFYARQAAKNAITPPRSGTSDSPYEKTAVYGSYDSSNGTVLVDGPVAVQPADYRPVNAAVVAEPQYNRPPPIQVPRNDQNPYADSLPNDYYNQEMPEPNAYGGTAQHRHRGGLTSPTHAYSQQRGGRMGAPPQYSYDDSRGMRPNTYNNGNGGRGRGDYTAGPSRDMGTSGEINPYQANIPDLALRSIRSPPRMDGYPPVRQQPGLYTDRHVHANTTDWNTLDPSAYPAQLTQNASTESEQNNTTRSPTGRMQESGAVPTQLATAVRINMTPRRPVNVSGTYLKPKQVWTAPYPQSQDGLSKAVVDRAKGGKIRVPPLQTSSQSRWNRSLDSLQVDHRQDSPARSDNSHFTSISQRGINPHWRPTPSPHAGARPHTAAGHYSRQHHHHHHHQTSSRRHRSSRDQVLFDSNPDFGLPPHRSMHASRARTATARRGGPSRSRSAGNLPPPLLPGGMRRMSSMPLPNPPQGAAAEHGARPKSGGTGGLLGEGRYPAPAVLSAGPV